MFSKKIILLLIFVSVSLSLSAQCLTYPVSFSSRTNSSSAVVEGKIISQSSFWNSAHNFIYTSSEIEVYKIFKGTITASQIVIITEGGIVGSDMVVVEPSMKLFLNDVGIFFLQSAAISNPSLSYPAGLVFEPYASEQGVIKYDLTDLKAHDVYNTYSNVFTQLYQPLSVLTGHAFQTIAPFNINDYGSSADRAAPVISTISPNPTTAGTLAASQITITGSNFGASFSGNAKLEFPDANTGGASYILSPANHIMSWNDNTIVALVVSGAGSGFIRITNPTNETTTASINLTVNYNETNITSGGIYYQPDLVNRNATGGYVFKYNTTFNGNAPAVNSFERALQTWRCGTYVNFSRNGTTSIATQALDGTNVVTFDGSSALPAGVLGTSYSFYSACATGVWYLNENDCKFRTNGTGVNWNYGPAATAGGLFDFESVCVHELGHSHQLGHTITPVTVMNYAIGPNTDRRTLTPLSETAGGNDIMSRSVINNSCGPTAMIALNNTNCPINAPLADFSGTPTSGCNSVTVNFTDLSTNTPTSWSWTFTGGAPATSTAQNPTVVYASPGTYNVTLTATNASGSDSQTYSSYITVNNCPPPTALFYGTPTTICTGQPVAFFDTSTNTPTSWSWTFPGGTPGTSTLQNPVVTYSGSGVFNVTLTATNAYGSNTLTRTSYITVNNCPPPPVTNFTGTPTTLCAGNTVTYTDLSSNSPTSWNWSFPGGTPSTSVAQNPVITYATAGVYSATLVASNSSGSNSFTRTNYITVNTCAAPVTNFTGWPTTICTGQSVNFTDLSTNSPTSWSWTFAGGIPATSSIQNPTVSYAGTGNFNVTLTATNGFGSNSFTRTAYINVNSCPASGTGLIVNDGSLIHVQGSGGLITVQGGFINQDNGANIGSIDNNGLITLTGDWTNTSVSNAFINIDSGEVQLLGSSQLITGTVPTYFYNLTLLTSGIKTQTLDARVLGTLALNDRELNTQGFVMYVTNASTGAITRTGGFNSTPVQGFVSSTGNGRLWRNTNSTGTYLFPVGSSLVTPRYRPIEIQPTSASANTFGLRFVNNDPNIDGLNRNNRDPNLGVINGLWYQQLNHVTGTNTANLTFYFDNVADAVISVPSVLMTEWGFGTAPVQWRDMGTVTPTGAGSPALSKVSKSAWNTYTTENFNIAPQSIILPVELIALNAVCSGNRVDVSWTTISETNSDYFSIERSINGVSFEQVGIISAAGNSSSVKEYDFTDNYSPTKTVYYQLTQFDIDGHSYRYGPLAVNCRISGTDDYAEVFPNPFDKEVSVLLNLAEGGNITLTISNALGEMVAGFSYNLKKGTHELPLSTGDFAPGFYHITVKTPSQSLVVKMIKGK